MFSGIINTLQAVHGRLQYLYVSLSNICNARCAYCDVHQSTVPQRAFGRETLAKILSEARDLGCETVHFLGGGEPLIDPHFPEAVEICTRLDLDIVVTTNGSHLGDRFNPLLRNARLTAVLVSLDSSEADLHDVVRGIPGLWNRAVQALTTYRRELPGVKLVLNHVVTRTNIEAVERFLEMAGVLKCDAVNLIPVKDTPHLQASPQQAMNLSRRMQLLQSMSRERGVELLLDIEDASDWAARVQGSVRHHDYRCVFPELALYIDFPTGGVFPCDCTVHRKPTQRFEIGNIWRNELGAIWNGKPVRQLREILRSPSDPGCKVDCDWNNRRTNRRLLQIENRSNATVTGANYA